MTEIRAVVRELRGLGFEPETVAIPQYGTTAVAFKYTVPTGRYRGQRFRMAISFQDVAYPEYPPHFLHVCSLPGAKLTAHNRYEIDGATWMAFSVPPSDFWDRLPPERKTMKTYFDLHVPRVWREM